MKKRAQSLRRSLFIGSTLFASMGVAVTGTAAPFAVSATGVAPQPAMAAVAPNAVGAPGARFGDAPAGTPLGNLQLQTQGNPNYIPPAAYTASVPNTASVSAWSGVPSSISGYSAGDFRGFQNDDAFQIGGFNASYRSNSFGYFGPTNTTAFPQSTGNAGMPTYGTLGGRGFQGFQDGAFEMGGFPSGVGTAGSR
jgi:hypothetical protein